MNRVFNNVFVRGSLFDTFDRDEDGSPIVGEAWNIYVGNEYGERIVHTASEFSDLKKWEGPKLVDDDDGPEYTPPWVHDSKGIERAERLAKRIQAHIDAGGELNFDHWYGADPCYGSAAYVDFDQEGRLIEWERAQG